MCIVHGGGDGGHIDMHGQEEREVRMRQDGRRREQASAWRGWLKCVKVRGILVMVEF